MKRSGPAASVAGLLLELVNFPGQVVQNMLRDHSLYTGRFYNRTQETESPLSVQHFVIFESFVKSSKHVEI